MPNNVYFLSGDYFITLIFDTFQNLKIIKQMIFACQHYSLQVKD